MSSTDHAAPGAAAHDTGHGHDEHGHAADTLGPIDWRMWGVGVLGVVVALVVAVGFAIATQLHFGLS